MTGMSCPKSFRHALRYSIACAKCWQRAQTVKKLIERIYKLNPAARDYGGPWSSEMHVRQSIQHASVPPLLCTIAVS